MDENILFIILMFVAVEPDKYKQNWRNQQILIMT